MFLRYLQGLVLVFMMLATPAAFVMRALPAAAQGLQPLPELSQGFNLEQYAAQTDTISKSFDVVDKAGFEISLPKTWLERMSLGQKFGEIARFDGPAYGDVRPYFSYKRLEVKRENSARLELINYMLTQGYVLRSIKEIDDRNAEALYVVLDPKGDSYVVRGCARIMGPGMLLAEYAVPVDAWGEQGDAQTFAMSSFKFQQDSDDAIEKRIERSYYDAIRFFYPASWFFEKEETPEVNRIELQMATRHETRNEAGRIRISVIGARSFKDDVDRRRFSVDVPGLLKTIRQSYEDEGYVIGDAVESRKPDLNLPVTFSALEAYNLRRRLTQYETDQQAPVTDELWIAVFKGEGEDPKTYVAEMFTPSRNADLYLWGTNTRAFEIILKSIQ